MNEVDINSGEHNLPPTYKKPHSILQSEQLEKKEHDCKDFVKKLKQEKKERMRRLEELQKKHDDKIIKEVEERKRIEDA